RPRVTIDATVLASPIRVQARFEAYIGTRIARDNRFRSIAKILRLTSRFLFSLAADINHVHVAKIDVHFFESVRWAPRCAAPTNGRVTLRRFDDHRFEFLVRRHGLSSHEHIAVSSKS